MFAAPKYRLRDGRSLKHARFPSITYTPAQVARAYGFPANLTGKGYRAGVISLGGAFVSSDFAAARQAWGLHTPMTVSVVSVNGNSATGDPGGADVENMMDCEIITGIAPAANINFYSCANTDNDFVAGVQKALSDGCDAISISWGAEEKNWPSPARAAMDAVFRQCAAAGVNVSVAAGDNGSTDGGAGNNADFPAASQWATACGGTSLYAPNGVIQSEAVWNNGAQGGSTGGGYSIYEGLPLFQNGIVQSHFRGLPDVAGPADPETGWVIYTGGSATSVGGTSAVAPMWAGLYLLLCELHGGRPGFLPALLYPHPEAFNDILLGNNGGYQARAGWDECTGLGSPKGPALFALLGTAPPVSPPPPPPPPVVPPPVVPPPVSPPPPPVVPPPVPPPVVPPDLESIIQGAVDKVLDGMIASAGPLERGVLRVIKKKLDEAIQQLFASGAAGRTLHTLALQVLDMGFAYAETKLAGAPELAALLEKFRVPLEQLLLQAVGL